MLKMLKQKMQSILTLCLLINVIKGNLNCYCSSISDKEMYACSLKCIVTLTLYS